MRRRPAPYLGFCLLLATALGCTTAPPPLVPESAVRPWWPARTFLTRNSDPSCWRVLSVDGGGVRGIIPAVFLEELQQRLDRPLYSYFDLIAGTSTGALLALGLTRPAPENPYCPFMTPTELVDFYKTDASAVFPPQPGFLGKLLQFFSPRYSYAGITGVLQKYFGDTTLLEALAPVLIPAYDVEERSHFFFHSTRPTQVFRMRDIARAATAAPTYLPPHRIAVTKDFREKGYVALIDGGVFANNPATYALAYLPSWRDKEKVLLLSLGTGSPDRRIAFEDAWGWGIAGWATPFLDIVLSDPGEEKELEIILKRQGNDYFRLQPDLSTGTGELDDASTKHIQALEDAARSYAKKNSELLDDIAAQLKRDRACPAQGGLRRAPVDIDPRVVEQRRAAVCRLR